MFHEIIVPTITTIKQPIWSREIVNFRSDNILYYTMVGKRSIENSEESPKKIIKRGKLQVIKILNFRVDMKTQNVYHLKCYRIEKILRL